MRSVKPVNPGRLNHRVKIFSYRDVETELGAVRSELYEVAEVWAEIKPLRGEEFLEYYRETNELQFRVTIRYRQGVDEKCVLDFNGRQFTIDSVINLMEANIYLEIYCTEDKDQEVAVDGDPRLPI